MGRAKFLSISILRFLFSNAGFPRVEREQWPEQSKQRGGKLPPRCTVCKDNASALGGGNYPTALILLRHRFLWQFRPNSRYLLLIRHRPIHSRIFSKKFCKYDYICHVFYVTIKAYKENGYGRKQSI